MARRCDICSLDLIDEYSLHGHLLGKKHMRNVELNKLKTKKEQNSIFVSRLPHWAQPDDIIKFFTQYGPIHYYKFGPRYVIIEFKNKETADELLSKPVYFNKWKFTITRRIIDTSYQQQNKAEKSRKQSTSDESKEDEENYQDKLRFELEAEPTFESQLNKFISLVQKEDNEVEECCDKVCISLNRVFRSSFPYGKAVRFGSTVTGLHLKGSDMDVFFDIGETLHDDDDTKESGDYKLQWTPKSVFKEAKSILFRQKTTFTHIIPIPLAKIPVIKFNHIPTNTDCDISFKHGLGVHNSQLIKFLLSLDKKLRPLMIIIKYWAKNLDISGTGKITNYSLIIAIIFYLQQPDVNLLPTIKELQSSCVPAFSNGWQINFNKNYKLSSDTNNISIPQLLYGFFKFYSEFNFLVNLISPLDGIIHPKIDYNKIANDLGIDIELLNLSRPVCIQDPIQLNHNIASGWSERLLQDFQKYCSDAALLCEESVHDDYKLFLPSLFDTGIKHKSKKPRSIQIVIPAGKFEDFGLPDDFEERDDIDNKQKYKENNWFSIVYKLIQRIFEDIFKFNVQVTYDTTNIKQIKLEQESDVHSKRHDKIKLFCSGKYCVSRNRKGKLSIIDPTLSCIDKESLISDKILQDLKDKKEETLIKFTCEMEKKINPLHVFMTLTDAQYTNKAFLEISNYMRSKIPSIIDKEFLHMIQYNKTV
ncbi:speckle targeted PIP5K1A-regulated poly(A) polymerase-like [Microplitis mediator]|uniref:speckle targeted PIP5K1A-regulated poly(A) polymerase-like n=1 Tax=Microplitis mediator TaxID=375433 RepID=UPI002555130D|nr:speckle targeted PIP5K1A-regulated poly(A) polymerase-like [Microplitis mediator]